MIAADRLPELRAHALKDAVPERMAVALVDRLEVVEVEDDEGDVAAPRPGLTQLGPQRLVKAAVVGQAGERVGLGQALERRLLAVEQDGEDDGEQHPDHAEDGELVVVLASASPSTVPQSTEKPRAAQGSNLRWE